MSLAKTFGVTLSDTQFRRVREIIYNHCGINLHDGKKSLVRSRLSKRLRQSTFDDFDEYLDHVSSVAGEQEFYNMVDSISTNLTSFFREKTHFDYLIKSVFPKLVSQRGAKAKPKIRAWSAGCSSGEEPYSMAITLLENIPNPSSWDIKILASDVSTRILQRARAGSYDSERVEPLSESQKRRFMIPNRIEGQSVYQVSSELQRLISFRYLNLMESWPFKGPFDFIFCRNVMIYFDKPTQARLVDRFYNCLAPGGILCIGHSESLTGSKHKFRYVMPATYAKP